MDLGHRGVLPLISPLPCFVQPPQILCYSCHTSVDVFWFNTSARGIKSCISMRKNFFPLRVTEPWPRLPREAVESPSLEIFQTCLDTVLCSLLWVTLLGQGVGLGDPQRSLPTQTILWFCDSVIHSNHSTLINSWAKLNKKNKQTDIFMQVYINKKPNITSHSIWNFRKLN